MRPDEEDDFSRFLSRHLEPFVYDRHVYLPDWERLGARPSLVNMVREPTARFVSQFFYLRARQRWRGRRERPAAPTWFSKSLDSCVLGGDVECGVGAARTSSSLTSADLAFTALTPQTGGRCCGPSAMWRNGNHCKTILLKGQISQRMTTYSLSREDRFFIIRPLSSRCGFCFPCSPRVT